MLNPGLVVLDISPYSSIGGEFGVSRGDVLDKINDCDLTTKSFDSCLQQLQGANQLGFCGIESIDTDDCCPSENATHICFESGQNRLVISVSFYWVISDLFVNFAGVLPCAVIMVNV